MGKARAPTTSTPLNGTPHQREESSHRPQFARLFTCLLAYSPVRLAAPPAKEGSIATASRRAIRRLLPRENMARCHPLPQSACGCSCRTRRTYRCDGPIALDVEVAHFMDRLKPAQNGLIFTFESTLRIDAHESISAMTPIRKNGARKRRAVVRAVAGEEGESRSPRMSLLY